MRPTNPLDLQSHLSKTFGHTQTRHIVRYKRALLTIKSSSSAHIYPTSTLPSFSAQLPFNPSNLFTISEREFRANEIASLQAEVQRLDDAANQVADEINSTMAKSRPMSVWEPESAWRAYQAQIEAKLERLKKSRHDNNAQRAQTLELMRVRSDPNGSLTGNVTGV